VVTVDGYVTNWAVFWPGPYEFLVIADELEREEPEIPRPLVDLFLSCPLSGDSKKHDRDWHAEKNRGYEGLARREPGFFVAEFDPFPLPPGQPVWSLGCDS